jgi:ribonucleoside-diphosphate reductase alpha chain
MTFAESAAVRVVPRMRGGYTTEVRVGGETATLTASALPDGRLREIALRSGKHGSTMAGLTDAFSTAVTEALRHGTPLGVIAGELSEVRFAPGGRTDDDEIAVVSSVVDYVARRLAADFPLD